MLKLLLAEINYFKVYLIGIVSLPIFFTIIALNDVQLFSQIYFLKKYFWSMVVGMGTYALVFAIWSLRKKEMRERLSIKTPLNINQISIVRWLFGIAPFIIVGLYIAVIRNFLPTQQLIFIERINGQLGMMFMFLVATDLVINSWIALGNKQYNQKILYLTAIIILLLLLSILVIYMVSTSLIKPFGFGGEEIFFFIWGIILSLFDLIIFRKRKFFLS